LGCIPKDILAALVVSIAAAAPAPAGDDPSRGATSGPRERLEAAKTSYKDARGRFFREYKAAKDDEIESLLGRYLAEIDRAAAEGMRLARDHAGGPVAVDALRFVVVVEQAGQLRDLRPTPLSDEALRVLRRDHVHAPGMGAFCEAILLEPHDPARDSLIRAVLDGHPSREDRGHACFALAELRRYQAKEIRLLRDKPEILRSNEAIRGRELMARFLANDPGALDAEADTLLQRVIAEFGEIPLPDGSRYRTLADRASAELLGRHDLAIGKLAPEIEGRDQEGRPFRLSDYRGNVVLLTFSGNWCGPCRGLYPEGRRLVERFRGCPFALLSVNTDDEVSTLRESIASGEISWRCWWDGRVGPIAARWGILAFPSLFLIDGDGVIRAKPGHQPTTLENDVEALLAKILARPSP
jgi:thiol-disulfide isomerase/thioredoxin